MPRLRAATMSNPQRAETPLDKNRGLRAREDGERAMRPQLESRRRRATVRRKDQRARLPQQAGHCGEPLRNDEWRRGKAARQQNRQARRPAKPAA